MLVPQAYILDVLTLRTTLHHVEDLLLYLAAVHEDWMERKQVHR